MKTSRIFLAGTIAIAASLAACSSKENGKGIDTANLDTSVSPKDDFYEYACGGWMKANPLKPEYSRFGTFDVLGETTREQVRELVDTLAATEHEKGTNAQKVADLFNLGMDSLRLNNEGAAPLQADLARIAGATRDSLVDIMTSIPGVDVFFGTGVEADLANADMNTMYWSQSGLGLGDRDYYTDNTENAAKIREAYKTYLTTLAKLIGYDDAAAARLTKNVMDIETALAQKQMTRTQLRNIEAQYNPTAVADLVAKYPQIDLKRYFANQGLDVDTVIVGQPDYYGFVAKTLSNTNEQALRDYLTASYVSNAAPFLSDDFINANFALQQVMSGVEEQQPRWKRALSIPNGFLGEALGELYVEKYFPASSKEKMLTLVGNLQEALGQH
ncbi:MAG: M13 family metallopeptidase, partial [Muribaculaceae bacterium]|nr:M13 family metallopeptidase [Muribaculaceae bacterium]